MKTELRLILVGALLSLAPFGFAVEEAGNKVVARILTYNVLADPVHKEVRLEGLFKIFEESDADIIALQEVAPWFLAELDKEEWMAGYDSVRSEGKRVTPGGLLILSKARVSKGIVGLLPSRQRRAYLIVETEVKGIKVAVANCHLESPLESGEIRASQLDLYFDQLAGFEDALFVGDFNFGDGEEPESGKLREGYVDSWRLTEGDAVGFTWDIEKSEMARKGSFPKEASRRIDRVFIRSEHLTAVDTTILGDEEISGKEGVFPSDHFGLISTVRVK